MNESQPETHWRYSEDGHADCDTKLPLQETHLDPLSVPIRLEKLKLAQDTDEFNRFVVARLSQGR